MEIKIININNSKKKCWAVLQFSMSEIQQTAKKMGTIQSHKGITKMVNKMYSQIWKKWNKSIQEVLHLIHFLFGMKKVLKIRPIIFPNLLNSAKC